MIDADSHWEPSARATLPRPACTCSCSCSRPPRASRRAAPSTHGRPALFPALLALALAASACALDTGVDAVEIPLSVRGTQVSGSFEGRDGVRITLDRAQLAFGPLYLCRARQAGELCETAALEWTDAAVVEALDPDLTEVGTLLGTSGRVRSFMYDLGLHSLLTERSPLVLEAARELNGHSVVLEGEAELEGRVLPFRFEVDVAQGEDNTQGVPVVSSTVQDDFEHEVDADTQGLDVEFDPRPWLRDVRFEAFVDTRSCGDAEPPTHVCAGDVYQRCDGMGGVESERDCAAEQRVCVIDRGCRARFEAEEDDQAWRAVRAALVSGQRPAFRWTQ